jgi:hypothetical protein
VLDRVLGKVAPESGPPPPDFGVRLGAENLDAALAATRAARDAYRRRNSEEVRALELLVAGTLRSDEAAGTR